MESLFESSINGFQCTKRITLMRFQSDVLARVERIQWKKMIFLNDFRKKNR